MIAVAPRPISVESWLAALYSPASRALNSVPTTSTSACCDRMRFAAEISMNPRTACIHLALS